MTDPLLVDLAECSRLLGQISTRTVRRLIETNAIRSVRVGRRLMVTMESLREYVDHGNPDNHTPGRVEPDARESVTGRTANNGIGLVSTNAAAWGTGGYRTSKSTGDGLAEARERPIGNRKGE